MNNITNGQDDVRPLNVTVGSQWVVDDPNPFNHTVVEVTNVAGIYVEYKYVIVDRMKTNTGLRYSYDLQYFHNVFISPECDKAKANALGMSLDDYENYLADMEAFNRASQEASARQLEQEAPIWTLKN